MQTRAASTRQKIIDSAIDLFADHGYATTGLNEIVARAGATTGAFYYHFGSKDALAAAIVQQVWPRTWEVVASPANSSGPGLENVITMTFSLSELMKRDKSVRVANHLSNVMGRVNGEWNRGFRAQISAFVDVVAAAVDRSDVGYRVDPRTIGEMVWMVVYGCHVLSDTLAEDVFGRLTENWRVLLRSIVPAESLDDFGRFLERTAGRFDHVVADECNGLSAVDAVVEETA